MSEERRLIPVDEVEKLVLLARADFGEAKPIFYQRFWLDPGTMYPRHRHPVMKELIGVVSGELDIIIQETPGSTPIPKLLVPGEMVFVRENLLHTLRNPGDNKVEGFAMGFILAENGITIRE